MKFLTHTNYWGQVVEMDAQGRLLLPQLLRDSADLKGDVVVTGYLDHLESGRSKRSERKSKNRFTADDTKNLHELGI